MVSLLLLWQVQAGVAPGQDLHLLGATALSLMFGWSLAVIALSVVLLATSLLDGQWLAFPLNALIMVAMPVSVSYGVRWLAEHYLPSHFFIYVFVGAFLGGAVSMASVGLLSTLVLGLSHAYPLDYLLENYAPFYILFVFPEAFISGALITLFVVYRPRWVRTFDDERYLKNH
jgi:uncharacterized membrane protein